MRLVHLVPAGAVLVALGVIAGAAHLIHPAAPSPDSAAAVTRQVVVTSAARACPPALGNGSGSVALIAGAGAADATGATGATGAAGSVTAGIGGQGGQGGQVELTALPPAGVPLRATGPVRAQSLGVPSLLPLPAGTSTSKKGASVAQGWSVSASGTMAQAMEAEVAQSSGLAGVRCGEPGADIWFVGPGQQNGATQIQLDLMNIDSLPASVDVSIITDAGQAQAGNDTGITVPPHQTVTESLSSMGSGSSVVAIEVHTSIGRVAADVSEGSSHGAASWLPTAAEPSTELVIPGVPPSSSAAGLFLAVPGTSSAKVNVLAITPQGHYRPFGSQTIDLPGESASYQALTPLGGTAAALEITSNVPVVAGVLVPGSGAGAFTAATAPISEQAVVAGNTTGSGLAASVVLSAPAGPARVRLTEIAQASTGTRAIGGIGAIGGGTGATGSQVVSVPAGHTLVAPVTTPRGARRGSAFAVVITPLAGSGPLYAARVETQGQNTIVSILPAASALTTINLPPVRDSYDAISPPPGGVTGGWIPP